MRIPKRIQYGILICLYLTRAGRCAAETMAKNLNIDMLTLQSIVDELVLNGVLIMTPDEYSVEEYALKDNPLIGDVYTALGDKTALSFKESNEYQVGAHEHRALFNFAKSFTKGINPFMMKTIRMVGNDLIVSEVNQMDKVAVTERSN